MIKIKTKEELVKIKVACKMAAEVLDMISEHVKVGTTTNELNEICHNYIINKQKAIPATLNYKGFPKSICTSLNNIICHGIPNNTPLKKTDFLNIDVTVIKDGYHGDSSRMYMVSAKDLKPFERNLIKIAKECLYIGIKNAKPENKLGDLGFYIQQHAEYFNYSVVRDFGGHGIGKNFHEEPHIAHFGKKCTGLIMKSGMVFTIEPMINLGSYEYKILNDNWTVQTKDKKPSAQWEHTIAITQNGCEVLTLGQNEKIISIEI